MASREVLPARAPVRDRYESFVRAGEFRGDEDQRRAADALDDLIARLSEKRLQSKSSALGWMFARKKPAKEPVRGLYLYGGVGRGKTMLMDLFYEAVPVSRKRRVHFNDFMSDVHDRITEHRAAHKRGETKEDDPIPPVAAAIAAETWLICFDEFTVTDIADAMVLSRLFSALFERGVVLVATSNVAPDDLYRDGLNRSLFTPFIDTLRHYTEVMAFDGDSDYRLEKLERLPTYVQPLGSEARAIMDEAWESVCAGKTEQPVTLTVKGREVVAKRAAGAAARFSFAELCEQPLGARDYLAIAARFATIVIDDTPVLEAAKRNEAKRFILLIDTLCDQTIRLFISADAPPDKLYRATSGTERFEFERTASRLVEMQSLAYHQLANEAEKKRT